MRRAKFARVLPWTAAAITVEMMLKRSLKVACEGGGWAQARLVGSAQGRCTASASAGSTHVKFLLVGIVLLAPHRESRRQPHEQDAQEDHDGGGIEAGAVGHFRGGERERGGREWQVVWREFTQSDLGGFRMQITRARGIPNKIGVGRGVTLSLTEKRKAQGSRLKTHL